jgi:hypothetical protein
MPEFLNGIATKRIPLPPLLKTIDQEQGLLIKTRFPPDETTGGHPPQSHPTKPYGESSIEDRLPDLVQFLLRYGA